MSFNKWTWVRECDEEIARQLKDGHLTNEEECWDLVFNMISDAVIYNSDCFEIVQELNFTQFEGATFPIKSIYDAAYNALYEWSLEQVSVDNLLSDVQ
jgi:hypothetical protein